MNANVKQAIWQKKTRKTYTCERYISPKLCFEIDGVDLDLLVQGLGVLRDLFLRSYLHIYEF